ncbi:EamA family transporter [Proteocatella sphenisci]|uniref:EamA family transporter n=1 Tax=Proteocatella sphenisci TaxID=181070 RepID=UPI00048F88FF|nr:EamA family transporter [Proteocatella sphenisci]
MKKKDFMLALLVVIVWGANFTVIKLGLGGVPSMLLVALRYMTVLPALFFVKKPELDWKYGIAYGFSVGVLQFSCLFYALEIGMPAGLSSIILQSAAFMTPLLAAIFLKEKIRINQVAGLIVAAGGLYLIGKSGGRGGDSSIPLPALVLTLAAAFFWATSNVILKFASNKLEKEGKKLDMVGVVIWTSLVPPLPLFVMSMIKDSPQMVMSTIMNLSPMSIFSIIYLALGATIFGYGAWNVLLGKYEASKIAPLSLMVPVTGLITARIVLGEVMTPMQWAGGLVIIAGLAIANINFGRKETKISE